MEKLCTWEEMIESIEELEKSLDTTCYLDSEYWENLAKNLNL